jgi:hypothetical protein
MTYIRVAQQEVIKTTDSTMVGNAWGPFTSGPFLVTRVITWRTPYLLVWYTTAYPETTSFANHSRVLINGTEIGRLGPHPWSGFAWPDDNVVALPFNANLLNLFSFPCGITFPPPPSCVNTVTITVPTTPSTGSTKLEYLWVSKIIVHYTEEWNVPQAT